MHDSREIVERLAIASYNHARDRAAKQKVLASPWHEASKEIQDAHRSIAERYLPEIERLLADEREKAREKVLWEISGDIAAITRLKEVAKAGRVSVPDTTPKERVRQLHGAMNWLQSLIERIRQLDLTKPESDLASSSREEGKQSVE